METQSILFVILLICGLSLIGIVLVLFIHWLKYKADKEDYANFKDAEDWKESYMERGEYVDYLENKLNFILKTTVSNQPQVDIVSTIHQEVDDLMDEDEYIFSQRQREQKGGYAPNRRGKNPDEDNGF